MNSEQKDFLGITWMQPASSDGRENGNQSVQDRVAQLACERDGDLPIFQNELCLAQQLNF